MSLPDMLNQDTLASCILIGIIALVGLIGNSLMLRALVKYDHLRIDVYVIFGGLAMADILHLIFAGSAKIIYTVQAFEVSTDSWCKISRFITNATGYVASYHIVVLSVLRGIVLTNRGHASPTSRHAFICSTVLWIVAVLASIPVFFTFQKDPYNLMCEVSATASYSTTVWLEGSFTFFLPLALVLALYGLTHYVGKRYFSDSYSGYARRMSRLITSIVIAFVVCQLPYQVFNLHVFYQQKDIDELLFEDPHYDFGHIDTLLTISDYLYCILLAGKCIRPVLYSKLADDLGDCFDEVINCTYCSKYYHTGATVDTRVGRINKRCNSKPKLGATVPPKGSTSLSPLTGGEETREEPQMESEGICEI